MIIPEQLIINCRNEPERKAWLDRLPALVNELGQRWSLCIDAPFDHPNVTCSWVAAATRIDGTPAVLKLGMPHMEGADEIHGLRFWSGEPTVQLLEADDELGAMLLERCQPGDMLCYEIEDRQDLVIADVLKRLWRRSNSPNRTHRFRHLSMLLEGWRHETLAESQHWPDPGLVRKGLQVLQALAQPGRRDKAVEHHPSTAVYDPLTGTCGPYRTADICGDPGIPAHIHQKPAPIVFEDAQKRANQKSRMSDRHHRSCPTKKETTRNNARYLDSSELESLTIYLLSNSLYAGLAAVRTPAFVVLQVGRKW